MEQFRGASKSLYVSEMQLNAQKSFLLVQETTQTPAFFFFFSFFFLLHWTLGKKKSNQKQSDGNLQQTEV